VLERGLLEEDRLDAILSVDAMTRGGVIGDLEAGWAGKAGGPERAEKAGKAGR